MAVTRSPKSKASEANIQALIEKGGQPARQETVAAARPTMTVSLRIPRPPAERLDTFLRERLILSSTPRLGTASHTWRRLDREMGEQSTTREPLSFSRLSGSLLHG